MLKWADVATVWYKAEGGRPNLSFSRKRSHLGPPMLMSWVGTVACRVGPMWILPDFSQVLPKLGRRRTNS